MTRLKIVASLLLIFIGLFSFAACGKSSMPEQAPQIPIEPAEIEEAAPEPMEASTSQEPVEGLTGFQSSATQPNVSVTEGADIYRGFVIDNILHSEDNGEIHYHVYIPDSYDGSSPYALFLTLPGYGGLYFQGVGANIQSEEFAFEAQKYVDDMIVVAPQLNDWGETSANHTIALVEYFIASYNIAPSKVYANGFSGGGETMSLVMEKRPELFAAYLHCSSQWDGAFEPVAASRTPVYLAIGENDEYYGSGPSIEAYNTLYGLYTQQGLSDDEIHQLLVLDIKDEAYFLERGFINQHGGGGLFAFDEEIMGWLFGR